MDGVRATVTQQPQPNHHAMKTKAMIIIAAAIGLTGAAHAEEGKRERGEHTIPPEIIAKFDKDGDGKLNEEERKAAKAAREEMEAARKKEILEKFDADKDGELNEAEREAMRTEMKKRMLEKFDKDGNGELSEEERAEMRKHFKDRPGHDRPHGKDRKGRKEGGGDKEAPSVEGEAPGAGQ